MRCDACGNYDARILRVARTYGAGADLLIIENVPLVSCPTCGESYLTAETLHEIESLRSRRHGVAETRPVGVVNFDAA